MTIAILGGLGAAVTWAVSTLCAARATRMTVPSSVVAAVMFSGLAITVPWCVVVGVPHGLWGKWGVWLLVAGAGNVGGLLAAYAAYRVGQVSLVAPITSTEGAIAAVIAVLAGEHLATGVGIALAVIAVGVCLAARAPAAVAEPVLAASPSGGAHARTTAEAGAHRGGAAGGRSLVLAAVAALTFGVGLYAAGRVSSHLPLAWLALSSRLVGAVVVAAPLALSGGLRVPRSIAPLVAISAVCEVVGYVVFSVGARHSVAVASVLSSQFAALAAIAAYFTFGERLARTQLAGVAIVVAGVTAISALSA